MAGLGTECNNFLKNKKMILTAKEYTNPRTGQIFKNATITTGDLFVSKELVTIEFHLKTVGGLNESFKMFWNGMANDRIFVERKDKDGKPEFKALPNLQDILADDIVQSYGKMDIVGLANNYEFDGQIPFEFNPTTELGWKQLLKNLVFFGEPIEKQFKQP